jgi:1-acyl-sn-glycerol-3-phosphate acyltransferase
LGLAAAWHRYRIEGFEHVPARAPALLVSFHALTVVDMFLLGRAIYRRDGRVVRGLTDTLVFQIPGLRDVFTTLGIVAGTQDNAVALLASGELAACMPGGGLEWSRPTSQARQMRWGNHRGYARLAIRAGVPIIPTACPSADRAYYVAIDGWTVGEALKRLLGSERVLPFPIWLGLLGPIAFPVKLTQYVAPPIWPGVPPEAADDEDAVCRLDERVRAVIAGLLERP